MLRAWFKAVVFLLVGAALEFALLPRAQAQWDFKAKNEKENEARIVELLKIQETLPPGYKKLEIEIDMNSQYPFSSAVKKYFFQIEKLEDELFRWKKIEKINSDLEKEGKAPIKVDFSVTSPFGQALHKYQQAKIKEVDEFNYSKQIQSLNAEVAKIGQPPVQVDLSQPYPYTHAYNNKLIEITKLSDDLFFFNEIEKINKDLAGAGKPLIEVDLSKPGALKAALDRYKDELKKKNREIEAKKSVEKYLQALKTIGKPVNATLDESKEYPYTEFLNGIKAQYPDIYDYEFTMNRASQHSMTCAETWQALIKKIEKHEDGVQQCEAEYEIQAHAFLPEIAKALKAANQRESEDEVRTREEKALKLFGKLGDKLDLYRRRPGFKDCGLTHAEFSAVVAYTGSFFTELNKALRKDDWEKFKPAVDTLNSALKKIAVHTGLVTRTVMDLGDDLKLYVPGTEVQLKAFTSTTTSNDGVGPGYKFKIESCSGRYVAPISSHLGEEEVLIPSGAKMKVISNSGSEIRLKEVCQ